MKASSNVDFSLLTLYCGMVGSTFFWLREDLLWFSGRYCTDASSTDSVMLFSYQFMSRGIVVRSINSLGFRLRLTSDWTPLMSLASKIVCLLEGVPWGQVTPKNCLCHMTYVGQTTRQARLEMPVLNRHHDILASHTPKVLSAISWPFTREWLFRRDKDLAVYSVSRKFCTTSRSIFQWFLSNAIHQPCIHLKLCLHWNPVVQFPFILQI